jgi:hypothetical protein
MFACNLPINNLSFGNCAQNILWEWYKLGLNPCIFPIGNVSLNSFEYITEDYKKWLNENIKKANKEHSRKNPTFKLWHLNGSLESLSEKQVLLTFHESSQITPTEANIIRNNHIVLVTSKYTKDVFDATAPGYTRVVPLGFDKNSFKRLDKQYFPPEVVSFGVAGKLEHRKRHLDVIRFWAKKYGNDRRFFLNCALFNQFLSIEQQSALIGQALEGKRYFNINFNPFMDSNEAYNDYLNSNHIVLGLSGAEGWGLPEFQSIGLGKHGLILNATGYKEWANTANSVLIEPSGMADMHDGIFFQKGGEFNQGQSFTWTEDSFYAGVDAVLARFRSSPINKEGLKLQDSFKWENTAKVILEALREV